MVSTSTRSDRVTLQDQVLIKGNSKPLNGLTELGCHVINMGHKSESVRQSYGYRPTPGLISQFNKTGGRRLNPELPNLSHQRCRCTYADIVRGPWSRVVRRRTTVALVLVSTAISPVHHVAQGKPKHFVVVLTGCIRVLEEDHMVEGEDRTDSSIEEGVMVDGRCRNVVDLKVIAGHRSVQHPLSTHRSPCRGGSRTLMHMH
jgi:hypothetical protein